jgi:O-antigen/teichoic acid export membrane protein
MAASGGTLALRGASLALGFISTVLLSRNLGASGYGVYAWAIAWTSVLQLVASLGLDTLLLRELAAQRVTQAWQTMHGLLRTGRNVVLASSLALTALGVVAGLTLVSPSQRPTFLVALASIPALSLITVQEGALRGLGKVVASRTPEDLVRPITLIVVLVLGWSVLTIRHTAPLGMALQVIATILAAIVSSVLVRRATPSQVRAAPPVATAGRWVRQAAPLILLRAINTLLGQIDIILVGVLRNSTQVALYASATRFAGLVGIAEFAVNAAFLPVASRLFAGNEIGRLRKGAPLVALAGVGLSAVLAAPLIAFAPVVLKVFGRSFAGGAFPLRILCISFVVSAICGQSLGLLTMTRNVRQVTLASGVALTSNVALNLALIPSGGARGAAVAWLLSVIIWNGVLELQVRRHIGISATPLALIPRVARHYRQHRS